MSEQTETAADVVERAARVLCGHRVDISTGYGERRRCTCGAIYGTASEDWHRGEVLRAAGLLRGKVTAEQREAARLAVHQALASRWMGVVGALGGGQGEYDAMLDGITDAILAALGLEVVDGE